MIVVIDCNVWISLAINGTLNFVADLFNRDVVIASSDDFKNELLDVFRRKPSGYPL
jgi:predicted nucleic acid-binding protein